jgi:DNA-binding beta-propeller fold protein YncE
MRRIVTVLWVWLAVAALALTAVAASKTLVRKVPFPHKRLGNIDRMRFPEPSGICYHPTRKTLFVVGDEGDVVEMKTDGKPVRRKMHGKDRKDYEGITVNPATGLLYVAQEGAEKILELDPDTLETQREFQIDGKFKGKQLIKIGGPNGIEAIEFVPDADHAEGGTFYVTNQSMRLKAAEDISAVFELAVPLKTAKGEGPHKATILRYFSVGAIDLAALHWDAKRKRLLVVSDRLDTLYECTTAGKVMKAYVLPCQDQEGITVDPDDYVYVAQDRGGIIKLKWLRKDDEAENPDK